MFILPSLQQKLIYQHGENIFYVLPRGKAIIVISIYKHLVSADIVIRIRGIIIDIKLKSTCIRIIIEIATEIRYAAGVEIRIITKGA